ncbi:MAG: hypothetical protein KH050_03475 [Clostridiaceae bacterium]|nr:hypothetical protein [Clostridiaceae bacterium]
MNQKTEIRLEKLYMQQKVSHINADQTERICVNCAFYEQYYRKNRGNVAGWVPTSIGYCLLCQCRKGALCPACKNFERK